MKILLVGSRGQLGSDLLRTKPNHKKIDLIAIDRSQLDLSETARIYPFFIEQKFDVLLNCAAYNRVDDAEDNPEEAFMLNAYAVRELSRVCQKQKSLFIHMSSDYVFSGKKATPYKDTDLPMPLSVYGASKTLGETFALECSDSIILRTASLFGITGSRGKGGNFVEAVMNKAKEQKKIEVVNDMTMSPTSTKDLARWIWMILENRIKPGMYNAVNIEQATWFDFAKEIISHINSEAHLTAVTTGTYPHKAVRPRYSVLDNSKLVAQIGSIRSWQEALTEYLQEKGY